MGKLNKFVKGNQNCRNVIKMFRESCWIKILLNWSRHENKSYHKFCRSFTSTPLKEKSNRIAWEIVSVEFNCLQVCVNAWVFFARYSVTSGSSRLVHYISTFYYNNYEKKVTFGFDTELLHSYLRWELSPLVS